MRKSLEIAHGAERVSRPSDFVRVATTGEYVRALPYLTTSGQPALRYYCDTDDRVYTPSEIYI